MAMCKTTRITVAVLLALLLPLAACGGTEEPAVGEEPTVIEPGLNEEDQQTPDSGEPEPEPEPQQPLPEDLFPDKGQAATLEDLAVAQSKIESYYFEQTVQYPSGHMFMQVWYKDGQMKVITSVDGVSQSEFYYDYVNMTVTTYYPGVSQAAMMADFDAGSPDAPQNPKTADYSSCTVLGTETVNRQTCLILQTTEGNKIWVGTKYGFPLQAEFTDSLGDQYTVQYKNVAINTITDGEVLPPADLVINNFSNRAGQAAAQ